MVGNNKINTFNKIIDLYFIKSYLCLCFLCISYLAKTQSNIFKHITQSDGLTSNDCYKIHQDAKGFIWITTEKGICKYNGKYFSNFTISKGLPNNVCVSLFEDNKHNIYPFTYDGSVSVIKNNNFSDEIKKVKPLTIKTPYIVNNIALCGTEGTDGKVYIGYFNKYLEIAKNNNVIFRSLSYNAITHLYTYQHKLYGITQSGIVDIKANSLVFYYNLEKSIPSRYCTYKNKTYFVYENNLFVIDELTIRKLKSLPEKNRITCLQFLNDSVLVLGTINGLSQFDLKNNIIIKHEQLNNKIITDILIDYENNMWVSTLGYGVYLNNNSHINSYTEFNDVSITAICGDATKLFIGTQNGDCYYKFIDSSKSNFSKTVITKINYTALNQIKNIEINKNRVFVAYSHKVVVYDFDKNTYIEDKVTALKSLSKTYNKAIYATTFNGLINLLELSNEKRFNKIDEKISIKNNTNNYSLEYDTIRKLFIIGHYNTLSEFKNKTLLTLPNEGRVDKIQTKNQMLFWLLNNDIGIQIYDRHKITTVLKNDTESYNDFYLENDSLAWIGGSNGLTKLELNTKTFTIKHKTTYLLNNTDFVFNIKKLLLIKNTFYFGTVNGLFEINKKDLNSLNYNIPIYTSNVIVNGVLQKIDTLYNLTDFQTNISIQFNGLYFQNPNKIKYRYKFLPIDTAWKYTAINKLDFPNLTSGNYILTINACDKYNYWSSNYLTIKINIATPFYKTWWFLILCYVIAILFIALIFYYIYDRNNKKREYEFELKNKIIRAEEIAFTSQLNPHFIFNTINSIQRYVLKSKPLEAFNHLSIFSNLMRNILVNSKSETIPLANDIENIKIYLQLEKLRFNEKLNYEINTHFQLSTSLTIPPMLIQPYIENAIWHGIMSKDAGGNVWIDYYLERDNLIVTIKDDGIGRTASSQINSIKSGTGSGLLIAENRLKLFSLKKNRNYKLEIIDLTENNHPSGTLIKLSIPV